MELRVLKYFLVTVQEGSITGAAKALHLTQPTLSKQLRELEEELGKVLLVRGSRKVTLTEEGKILWRHTEEIFKLIDKTKSEILDTEGAGLFGSVVIGSGESRAVHLLTSTMRQTRKSFPGIRYEVISGDTRDVLTGLEDGTMDFGVLFEPPDISRYDSIELPLRDRWGVLMRKDADLADQDMIQLSELLDKPLIMSRQLLETNLPADWFGSNVNKITIAGTYSLINNGALMVEDNLGYAITLDHILNLTGQSHLCFRPLESTKEVRLYLIWKKYKEMSRQAGIFLREVRTVIDTEKARQQARAAERA